LRPEQRWERRQEEGAQERRRRPAQEEVEVEAGGGEDGVEPVAVLAVEVVAVHAMVSGAITGSTAGRRFISGLMAAVAGRT